MTPHCIQHAHAQRTVLLAGLQTLRHARDWPAGLPHTRFAVSVSLSVSVFVCVELATTAMFHTPVAPYHVCTAPACDASDASRFGAGCSVRPGGIPSPRRRRCSGERDPVAPVAIDAKRGGGSGRPGA